MEKYIPPSAYDVVDFTIHDTARTDGLDACIASITYSEDEGTGSMSHLFYNHDFGEYIGWLRDHVNPRRAITYLVGGVSYFYVSDRAADGSEQEPRRISSIPGIRTLKKLLHSNGFRVVAQDILGRKTRNATLTRDGRLRVDWRDYGTGTRWQSGVLRPGATFPYPLIQTANVPVDLASDNTLSLKIS